MKRRVVSIITVLALCLSLCPTQALAADWEPDTGLCSHHPVHTEECGYVPPTPGRDCTHEHDESCFITETQCVHQHTEECYPEPGPDFDPELEELEPSLCTHVCSEDSGCVTLTLDCHHVHDESCGYVPEDSGAPCTFVCRICPIEDLIDMLPRSVTPDNRSQVEEQLKEILALYTELTGGEQEQLDLSRCLDLQTQLDAANAPMLLDTTGVAFKQEYWINKDTSNTSSYSVMATNSPLWFDANGFEFSVSNGSAIIVQSTYTLYIKSQTNGTGGGAITSKKGAGVEVQSGSVLRVEDPNVVITGTTYGLDIASGADVQLSGGTFTGRTAAIQTADGDYGALLEKGYAYFDASGNPILPANVAPALTVVVKECTDHVYNYTHTSGATTHKWLCDICGAEGTGKCTFDFDADGAAACVCGNQIKIAINPDKIYNGATQSVGLTVTLQDGSNKVLTENTDYKVEYVPRVDVGEITVTVTGITYDGTFTTTCSVVQDQPAISWDNPACGVDYDGSPVDASDLPGLTISTLSSEDLSGYIQYSYRKTGGTDFINGLPTNAGTYEIKASLPEQLNYKAAETSPCLTLTIRKIPALLTAPAATQPDYNRAAQNLVTAGSVRDGAVIEFKLGTNGSYSTDIPTGIDAGEYDVWYRVADTENYTGVLETKIPNVRIQPKPITPRVDLSATSYVYDGSKKEPAITVRDGQIVIEDDQYTVSWDNDLKSAGTHTATIASTNKNYAFTSVTASVEIVAATQVALSITGVPSRVCYGDTIQLGTDGGTGNGTVAWSITGNTDTTIDPSSGQLIVEDVGGPITVTAERTSSDNYNKISATWVFYASEKPVTAVLTGVSKPFDNNVRATVKAAVDPSDLVSGDSILIDDLDGVFEDCNVETNKQITITTSSPTVSGTNSGKYNITYPTTATASITPVDAAVSSAPQAAALTYDAGNAQELVSGGTATGGTMMYSLNGTDFSLAIPTAKDAGNYRVYYKVQGDSNHNDSAVNSVPVEILRQQVTPQSDQIELTPPWAPYDGSVNQPKVTIRDGMGHVIPESEYKVTYDSATDWCSVGPHTVKIEDVSGGNYIVDDSTAIFTIRMSESSPLTIINKPGLVYYGDSPFTLSAIGGSGQGAITWKSSNSIAEVDSSSGLVTIKDVGTVTITAEKAATDNYDSSSATYSFTVQKKPVTAVVTAEDKEYDGDDIAQIHVTLPGLVGDDSINTSGLSGKFEDKNAGTDKTVTVTGTLVSTKYDITIPSTTASILKATPSVDPYPTASSITSGQTLRDSVLSGGAASANGSVDGSFDWEDGTIEPEAGTAEYAVIFTPDDTVNYNTVTIQVSVTVTEPPIDPPPGDGSDGGSNDGDGTDSGNTGGDDADSGNTGSGDADSDDTGSSDTISDDMGTNFITMPSGAPSLSQPSAVSAPEQTSVQNGTATTVLSATDGDKLVSEAIANQSANVVIKPEITGSVTKTEVSIPVSTVSQLKSETNANLTVSTPIADVTIPNAALGTLSSAGGDVSVVTEQVENTVTLTLTAGGENIESVPGGLTLTVPVEDAGPGTVAVLVHEDGTRETIRKSIAENGAINIPLDGSATVEIVDNSKEFADVPADSWAADAVAFASAHELFNGTGETTFSPEQPMSRAMLATVLYNLEGSPAQSLTNEFSDVGSDDWYAAGVSWAAANGITNGYGDGQFGPNDSITREQFAVMLWKYAGCPAADGQALNFTDADQISSYAVEALCWATANGILSGYGDGQLDPGGLATRAQAAKMLQNFMEGL